MFRVKALPVAVLLFSAVAIAQQSPSVSQVLMYSATMASQPVSGTSINVSQAVPAIFSETVTPTNNSDSAAFGKAVTSSANYSSTQNFVQLTGVLNASIATALSIVPLSSPASGVIDRTDPATGASLPEASTLGPIFTERAETIRKGKFYIGFSNQSFHFTKFNGTPLNGMSVLSTGGTASAITFNGSILNTAAASFAIGMDVRLSQNITFLTYGVTDRFDLSLGVPVVHSAVAARTYNGTIYAGNGFGNPTCWCADTFTPGTPTLIQNVIGQSALSKTGLGDLLIRGKATVKRTAHAVIAVGGDLRLPTGSAENFLGVGTTTYKPFAAVSFYSKELSGVVISPHFDVGWEFGGKSILGGRLQPSPITASTAPTSITYYGAPFLTSKGYLPDVFTWAAGAEVAIGRRNTFVFDLLANQVGLIHGIPNATNQTLSNVAYPTGPNGNPGVTPTIGPVTGLMPGGPSSFGQYYASIGYKARVVGNLVANANFLFRLDSNGLVSRFVPQFGLGYSF